MQTFEISITIDNKNRISEISDGWSAAALSANATALMHKEEFVGKSIELFLGGDNTQMYYDALFKLVRLKGEVMERKYRCDSFTHERHMLLRLIPKENSSIEMQHFTLSERPFSHEVVITSAPKNELAFEYIKRCSICNSLLFPDASEWMPPEELSLKSALHLRVIHTVCPTCKNKNWFPSKSTS